MLAKESQIQVDEKYNLAYILDPTDEKKMAIQSLKELTGVETKIILDMKILTNHMLNGLIWT